MRWFDEVFGYIISGQDQSPIWRFILPPTRPDQTERRYVAVNEGRNCILSRNSVINFLTSFVLVWLAYFKIVTQDEPIITVVVFSGRANNWPRNGTNYGRNNYFNFICNLNVDKRWKIFLSGNTKVFLVTANLII